MVFGGDAGYYSHWYPTSVRSPRVSSPFPLFFLSIKSTNRFFNNRVPNLPFFYLVYRAWSHHRALSGGKHISFLLQHASRLLSYHPSPILDEIYSTQRFPLPFTSEPTTGPEAETIKHPDPAKVVQAVNGGNTTTEKTDGVNMGHVLEQREVEDGEVLLLSQENAKKMVQLLEVPELEVELERAIWQVETAVEKKNREIGAEAKVDDTKKEKEKENEKVKTQ